MDKKTVQIVPFKGEKEKSCMWLGKSMARAGIRGYHLLLTSDQKIPAYDAEKTKENEIATIKLPSFTAYNELILAQEEMVCFQIFEEVNKKSNKYGDARIAWTKISRKFEPTTGASKTRLGKKFNKCELYYGTRNPKA